MLTLTCTVLANPVPEIIWLRRNEREVTVLLNTTRLSISTQYRVSNVTATSVLSISRTEPSDQGEYVCEVKSRDSIDIAMHSVGISGMWMQSPFFQGLLAP